MLYKVDQIDYANYMIYGQYLCWALRAEIIHIGTKCPHDSSPVKTLDSKDQGSSLVCNILYVLPYFIARRIKYKVCPT